MSLFRTGTRSGKTSAEREVEAHVCVCSRPGFWDLLHLHVTVSVSIHFHYTEPHQTVAKKSAFS